jgi:hypothetical protein
LWEVNIKYFIAFGSSFDAWPFGDGYVAAWWNHAALLLDEVVLSVQFEFKAADPFRALCVVALDSHLCLLAWEEFVLR